MIRGAKVVAGIVRVPVDGLIVALGCLDGSKKLFSVEEVEDCKNCCARRDNGVPEVFGIPASRDLESMEGDS